MRPKIAKYDQYHYDYKTYWSEREYENQAEFNAIEALMSYIKSGKRIIDIGGSFGRLLPLYNHKFEESVIVDYSLETLRRNEKTLHDNYANIRLIAANAYFLPFKENSFDGAIMVRVLHHIIDVPAFYKELERAMGNEGFFIQEFANKVHLKARIKWLLQGKFSNFNRAPYQQPTQGNLEGSQVEETVFLNFHPDYIKKELTRAHFKLLKKANCSFLRIPYIKKVLKLQTMLTIEKIMQNLLYWSSITPSILYLAQQSKHAAVPDIKFEEILCCPSCKGGLAFTDNHAHCTKCKHTYEKIGTIWDFRVESNEQNN